MQHSLGEFEVETLDKGFCDSCWVLKLGRCETQKLWGAGLSMWGAPGHMAHGSKVGNWGVVAYPIRRGYTFVPADQMRRSWRISDSSCFSKNTFSVLTNHPVLIFRTACWSVPAPPSSRSGKSFPGIYFHSPSWGSFPRSHIEENIASLVRMSLPLSSHMQHHHTLFCSWDMILMTFVTIFRHNVSKKIRQFKYA